MSKERKRRRKDSTGPVEVVAFWYLDKRVWTGRWVVGGAPPSLFERILVGGWFLLSPEAHCTEAIVACMRRKGKRPISPLGTNDVGTHKGMAKAWVAYIARG